MGRFDELMSDMSNIKNDLDDGGIVKDQPLREIKTVEEMHNFSNGLRYLVNHIDDEKPCFSLRAIKALSYGTTESETDFDNDINNEEGGNENYKTLCDICMIKDILGCNGCGIYQYAINRNKYEITVRRNVDNGVDTE